MSLASYCDTDNAYDLITRKSSTGVINFTGKVLVIIKSKYQTHTEISAYKSKFMQKELVQKMPKN